MLSIIQFVMEIKMWLQMVSKLDCSDRNSSPWRSYRIGVQRDQKRKARNFFISAPISWRERSASAAGGGGETSRTRKHTSLVLLLSFRRERWWHIKYSRWRMAGERKQPETRPSFYWVMDIFSKEPSRAALLKVTELTLSTDNINGIVDVSVSSFIFFSPSSC